MHADGTPPCPVGREPSLPGHSGPVRLSCWVFPACSQARPPDHAVKLARLSISKDLALRAWVADLGGLYAPVTPGTPPNPWLAPENRDFTLSNGMAVTRINPAYAFRLVQERWMKASTGQGRLVSLRPIRPANQADPWEAAALEELIRNGGEEKLGLDDTGGQKRVRLIHILRAEKNCLTCHAVQGYREGEVIGGLSVSPPLAEMARMQETLSGKITLVHFLSPCSAFWAWPGSACGCCGALTSATPRGTRSSSWPTAWSGAWRNAPAS